MGTATTQVAPGFGIAIHDCWLTAHAALVEGDVCSVDLTDTTSTKQPQAGDVDNGICVIAQETIASGSVGRFRVSGASKAKLKGATSNGARLAMEASADLHFDASAADEVICAICIGGIAAAGVGDVLLLNPGARIEHA